MKEEFRREVYVYKDYFWDFYEEQNKDVQKKIDWVVKLIEEVRIVPEKYFKHIESTDGLYEIRVQAGSDIYRIFSFFDEGNLIILLNGFQKKSDRTPKGEIDRAEKLRKEYYYEKSKSK